MAADNQLRARLKPTHTEKIDEIAEQRGTERVNVEREVIEEGLVAMGHVDRPSDGADLLLWYVRRVGLVFGVVGLIMLGYGVFGPRSFSIVGFSLVVAGFGFIAAEEFSKEIADRLGDQEAQTGDPAGQ